MKISNSYYGIRTVASDGVEYASKFEAEFVDRILIPSGINYEPQKLYDPEFKFRCDFYLPDFDVWIECVYNDSGARKAYMLGHQDIVLKIGPTDKDGQTRAKTLKAKWNPQHLVWILPRNMVPETGLPDLEKYMYKDQLEIVLDVNTVQMTESYKVNLRQKIQRFGDSRTIIEVTREDLDRPKIKHFADLLRIKNNKLYQTILHKSPNLLPPPPPRRPDKIISAEEKYRAQLAKEKENTPQGRRKKMVLQVANEAGIEELQEHIKVLERGIERKRELRAKVRAKNEAMHSGNQGRNVSR